MNKNYVMIDGKKYCEWIRYDYRTMCPKNHGGVNNPYWRIPYNMDNLKYCPYCGKMIALEKESENEYE